MRIVTICLLLTLFCPTGSFSYDYFFGSTGCGELVSDSNKNNDEIPTFMMSYILGFIAGTNYMKDRESPGGESLSLWVLNYCKQNPLSSFNDALTSLDRELDRKAGK